MKRNTDTIKNKACSFEWLMNNLLTVFASLNLFVLIFYNYLKAVEEFEYINIVYTFITLAVFTTNYLYAVIKGRLAMAVLRQKIPDLLIIIIAFSFYREPLVFHLLLIIRQTIITILHVTRKSERSVKFKRISENAAIFVLLSFLITILLGTFLLSLPIATVEGNNTTLTGALFTATSATCVTGLVVYETGTHFTKFGQVIILLLFQIGGLGIMTISTSFAILMGQKLSLRGESIMQNVIEETNRFNMLRLIRNIVLVTLIFEAIGSILLYNVFRPQYTNTSNALFSAVFHSISSFCNAGFSLFSDSFMGYKGNWILNFTVMILIVFGGIGFSVLVDLKKNIIKKFRPVRFSLHTKLILTVTIFLIILGFVLFFITEYNHSMAGYSMQERLLGSLFQSVTSRTAGFNTVDTSQFSNSSSLVSIFLMFIGASPGSTGGGIKTTSFAIIFLTVVAIVFGNKDVVVFKRKIHDNLIRRVLALIAISASLLFFVILVLMMVEPFSFIHLAFEAFSAFGTVGLSMGVTPYLSDAGRMLIVILMYFGRVGPLTLIFALSKTKMQDGFSYAEEKVSVG